MNLRLKADHFRFRLSRDDSEQLLKGLPLKEEMTISESEIFYFEVVPSKKRDFSFKNSRLSLQLSPEEMNLFSNQISSEDGLILRFPRPCNQELKVSVEVDLRS